MTNNYGWKFTNYSFTKKERDRFSDDQSGISTYLHTFIEGVCNREREILRDKEIPDESARYNVVLAHRQNARDELARFILDEFGRRSDMRGKRTDGLAYKDSGN